jgi:hypothetical protein
MPGGLETQRRHEWGRVCGGVCGGEVGVRWKYVW